MPRPSILYAAVAIAGLAGPAGTAEINEETTYFAVRGSTLAELDADLQQRGPVVGTGGARHPGATSVRFDGHVTYTSEGGLCRVDETHLRLDLEIMLPEWRSQRGASRETALIWRTVSEDIARHEQQHAAIAKDWLRRMEGALRNLRPQRGCEAMEASVNQTTRRYLQGHERAQIDFDTVEGREVGFRLRRALRANERAAAAP